MQIVSLVGVLLFMFAIVAASLQFRKVKEEAWRKFAAQRGFQVEGGGWSSGLTLSGSTGGLPVIIQRITRSQGKSSATYTVYRATIPARLPDGLHITHQSLGTALVKLFGGQDIPISDRVLDGKLRVRGEDDVAVRELLDDPDVSLALYPFASAVRYSRIEDGQVVIEHRGMEVETLGPHLDQAVTLARALADARLRHWRALSARHDLSLRENGAAINLEGTVAGHAVGIRAGPTGQDAETVTAISVQLSRPLPHGLRVERAGPDAPTGIRLADPVLGGAVTVAATDAEAARRLFSARTGRDLRADLLAVVHGHPGSRVEATRVVLVADGSSGSDAPILLDEALALARSLDEAARATETAAGGSDLADAEQTQARRTDRRQREPT